MTEVKILTLALRQALQVWDREDEFYKANKSELNRIRMENAWNDVKELEELLRKAGA